MTKSIMTWFAAASVIVLGTTTVIQYMENARLRTQIKANAGKQSTPACSTVSPDSSNAAAAEEIRIKELNGYWAEVSRCVREGDFDGYKATCHQDGVIVSGTSKKAYPLSEALARWEQDFINTRSGKIKGNVEFRFSRRLGDATTAHETGMFCYTSTRDDGTATRDYIHLEALLLKRGTWQIMMEYQQSKGTEEEWNKLKD